LKIKIVKQLKGHEDITMRMLDRQS